MTTGTRMLYQQTGPADAEGVAPVALAVSPGWTTTIRMLYRNGRYALWSLSGGPMVVSPPIAGVYHGAELWIVRHTGPGGLMGYEVELIEKQPTNQGNWRGCRKRLQARVDELAHKRW